MEIQEKKKRNAAALIAGAMVILGIYWLAHDSDGDKKPSTTPEPATKFDTGLRGVDAQILSGNEGGIAGGNVATFDLPITEDEAKYLSDMHCLDERECYGDKRFYQFIIKTYPDISKIKFPKSKALEGLSKEELDGYRYDFYRALYLSKRITLANGQTLFDFIAKCGKGFSSTDAASFDEKKNVAMQFFPVFRRLDNGQEEELQILFYRIGDKVTARSPWFSSHVMQDKDFLKQHGVRCWNTAL